LKDTKIQPNVAIHQLKRENLVRPSNTSSIHKRQGHGKASLWLHGVWVIVFSFLILFGPFGGEIKANSGFWSVVNKLLDCSGCQLAATSVTTAGQMSPLELVSISLTILGIILAIGAFGSFFVIRGAAMDAAADEAKQTVLNWLEQNKSTLVGANVVQDVLENDRFIRTLANSVERRISEVDNDAISDDDARRFADALDDEEGEG
jgi:hypothetical protein